MDVKYVKKAVGEPMPARVHMHIALVLVGCELKYTQQQAPQYISAFIQMNSIVVAGTLTATVDIPHTFFDLPSYPGDVSMPVTVTDAAGDAVVTAHVHLYITEKPNASTKRS
jgi:hypothetical protein